MNAKMTTKERALATQILLEIVQDWHCSVRVDDDEVTVNAPFGEAHAHHSGDTLLEALRRALDTAKDYAVRFPTTEGDDLELPNAGTAREEKTK